MQKFPQIGMLIPCFYIGRADGDTLRHSRATNLGELVLFLGPIPRIKFALAIVAGLAKLRHFNVRAMTWVMSISDAASNPIVTQIPLLVGRNLTQGYSDARLPAGYFVCLDMTGQGQQPGLASFNSTHKLFFVEQ